MAMILFSKLDEEWAWLARSKRTKDALRRWTVGQPILASFGDPAELVEFVQRRNQPQANDRVHRVLVALAPTDELAARTMLCAIQPGLVAMALQYRLPAGGCDEAASLVVAAAVERIRTYPLHRRPEHIAANILLDTRQHVSRDLYRPRVQLADPDTCPDPFIAPATESAAAELRDLFEWARRCNRLGDDDLRLIFLTRLAGVTFDELATQQLIPASRLRQRRLRAEAALADLP